MVFVAFCCGFTVFATPQCPPHSQINKVHLPKGPLENWSDNAGGGGRGVCHQGLGLMIGMVRKSNN